MLFASRHAAYRHIISPGTMRWIKESSGTERQIDNGDFFWAEFKQGGLTFEQNELAVQEFRRINPRSPFGAERIMVTGTINQMDAATDGEVSAAHDAYVPQERISRFDTEDRNMCPQRWQASVEECLQASSDLGRDFIQLDYLELVPPWETYGEMTVEEVVAFALAGGIDIGRVIRYEKGTLKRDEFGRALLRAQKIQEAQRAEKAALTVTS